MPVLERAPIVITAENLAGKFITHAEKTLSPSDVYRGKNWRQNKDGGRYPRPGYEDSGIDYTSYAFTFGRGILSAKTIARMWLAGDNGSNVKLTYVDTDVNGDQYGEVLDVGLTLATGKYVSLKEWQGNIYYANGSDTVGKVMVGQVATGGVSAGATEINLKDGRGIFFSTSGSGQIGSDTFSWTGKSASQLTGVTGLASNHSAGEVITATANLNPTFQTKASFIEEWLASLNLGGSPEQPFVWEFSKFANAGAPENFEDFGPSAEPEIVGSGGILTAFLSTKNFFYVWKTDSLYATARFEIDLDTGARPPQPIEGASGNVNPRTVTQAGKGGDAYYQTPNKHFVKLGVTVQNAQATVGLNDQFDVALDGVRGSFNIPSDGNWTHYNGEENFLKFSVFENDVRVVYVYDFNVGTFYRDTNKNYDCICQHSDGKSWAFDGSACKLFIDESGNFDYDLPVEMEWETGRVGREEFQNGRARYVHMHGYMTQGSINYIDFYKDNDYQFTKILDDSFIISLEDSDSVMIGHSGIGSSGFGNNPAIKAYPFRLPIGANHRAEDYKIKVRSLGENGDFVQFDGYSIGISPLDRSPYRRI